MRLIIGAFIPRRTVGPGLELQGIVLFALYILGVVSAMGVAYVLKRMGTAKRYQFLMLELPAYHWPNARNSPHRPVATRGDFLEPRRHHHPRA